MGLRGGGRMRINLTTPESQRKEEKRKFKNKQKRLNNKKIKDHKENHKLTRFI